MYQHDCLYCQYILHSVFTSVIWYNNIRLKIVEMVISINCEHSDNFRIFIPLCFGVEPSASRRWARRRNLFHRYAVDKHLSVEVLQRGIKMIILSKIFLKKSRRIANRYWWLIWLKYPWIPSTWWTYHAHSIYQDDFCFELSVYIFEELHSNTNMCANDCEFHWIYCFLP